MNNNKKQIIRLTESDLHRIIKESVNNILSEYKNDSTRLYNDMVDDYMSQGYDRNKSEYKAHWDALNNGWEKRASRHPYNNKSDEELATDRAIDNFMDDKNDEWWKNGKNRIITTHRSDNEGNEWDEEDVEGPIENRYKPSPNVFKNYMKKHNRPLDTRYGIERRR